MIHPRSTRLGLSVALAALVMLLIGATTVAAQEPAVEPEVTTGSTIPDEPDAVLREIVFPVDGDHRFVNDWYYPRDGLSRRHWGIDIPAVRMTPLVSTVDGTVTRVRHSNVGAEGNMVIITDADGWRYLYMHLNNDTPGTADNANPIEYAFAPGLAEGMTVKAGQLIGYVGDSGRSTGPHLHFAITAPGGGYVNPYWSLIDADAVGQTPFDFLCRGTENPKWGLNELIQAGTPLDDFDGTPWSPLPDAQLDGPADDSGVETSALRPVLPGATGIFAGAPTTTTTTLPVAAPDVATAGEAGVPVVDVVLGGAIDVAALGDAGFRASLGDIEIDEIVDIERTADGRGFYLLDRWGDVQELGSATYFGSIDDYESTGVAVAIAGTPDGNGYWILEADGGIHPFGSAENFGSLGTGWLTAPLIDFSPSPDGEGLILVAEDGTVFAIGHARYGGSLLDLQGIGLIKPKAIQMTVTGNGYWILADNGQVLTFGDAEFSGSKRGGAACRWDSAVGVVSFTDGAGSWVVADDLQAWAFGDARETGPLRAADPIGVTPPPDIPVVLPRDESDDALPEVAGPADSMPDDSSGDDDLTDDSDQEVAAVTEDDDDATKPDEDDGTDGDGPGGNDSDDDHAAVADKDDDESDTDVNDSDSDDTDSDAPGES